MIRKMTENDRELYIRMAEEFYSSDAVLHPVPHEYFERTADEALRSDAYAEIYLLEYEGRTDRRIRFDCQNIFTGGGSTGALERGTLYQRRIPLQMIRQGIFLLYRRKKQRKDCTAPS